VVDNQTRYVGCLGERAWYGQGASGADRKGFQERQVDYTSGNIGSWQIKGLQSEETGYEYGISLYDVRFIAEQEL
jgi:hypothetical protein